MILRRIIEHVKAQNWMAIVLDFVIVVSGVFIGLQVQEWSNQQEDRQREMQIIADLLADLEIDRPQYANGLAADVKRVSAANASLAGAGLPPIEFDQVKLNNAVIDYSFDPSSAPELSEARFDRIWTDIVIGFHPTPSTSAYDAMVGAGDIKLIRDREIVRAIQLYRNTTDSVVEQNQKLYAFRKDVQNVGAVYGLAPYASMPAEDYFQLVASEPQLAAAIRIQATYSIYHYGEVRTADAQAANLQKLLTEYLEGAK